ncbi:MAG: CinA family protein [Phenylobacterium sp.]|nr:CinA family protein [Phenylobacterium sp.]
MIETFKSALPDDIHHLAERLMFEISGRRMMVSLAESCTGGLLAAVLTDVEGSSHSFDRGYVAYTDTAKHRLLGVSEHILDVHGAVSAQAAKAMVEGVLAASDADLALSVTGFAGPGGPGEEPGLVYFGLQRRGRPARVERRRFGDVSRSCVRLACLRTGLSLLGEEVK